MDARKAKLLDFLRNSQQFEIPIYQRTYSWELPECRRLWDDIMRAGSDDSINAHFIGSIVHIAKGLYSPSTINPIRVIDGQQRLTTLMLLLDALADSLDDGEEPLDGFTAKKIRNYYLCNPEEDGDLYYKIQLTQTDKTTMEAIIGNRPLPAKHSVRIMENHKFFREQIDSNKGKRRELCQGILKLVVVDISLDNTQDDPQLIFESLNSTGKDLSQADLIRNFVLMRQSNKLQQELYNDYWRPMEEQFGQEAYAEFFDAFMRNFLTIETGSLPRKGDVYHVFKKLAAEREMQDEGLVDLVRKVRRFADFYCRITLHMEQDDELKRAFENIVDLKVDVSYPMILELYSLYEDGKLTRTELLDVLRMIESYVFRRFIVGIPTNSLNRTFSRFMRNVDMDNIVESIKLNFASLTSYRRFPDNAEFRRELKLKDLYRTRLCHYCLTRLENNGRKPGEHVRGYTSIEHIMPQNENLTSEWKRELGDNWEEVHENYLHTIGNLTLSAYNSELSDSSFTKKRNMEGGYAESPLRINTGLRNVTQWNEGSIMERAGQLTNMAINVWPYPPVDKAKLDEHKAEKRSSARESNSWSINDHPNINVGGGMHELYKATRNRILSEFDDIYEDFLQRYVSYKVESNIVDIVTSSSKNLKAIFSMPFKEMRDEEGRCKDLTGTGRLGGRKILFVLESESDIDYLMDLVRQSYNYRVDSGEEDSPEVEIIVDEDE